MKNISKNIGKFVLGVSLPLCAVGMNSCSDFLEVEPQNIITIDQFWNEEQDVTSSIAGCYSAMQSYNILSRMLIWGEFRAENVVNRGTIKKDADLERILKESLTASNGYTTWDQFYNVINRCNIIIHYAPEVQANDPSYTKSELKAHIAEATAIRSLCYFYLIRTFRNVPYTEEPYMDDSQKMNQPAEDFYVVLDKLIASLEEVKKDAIVYYPATNSLSAQYQTGRITQLAIYAMLCEMYLWKQDYASCVAYADLVIDFKKKYIEERNATKVDYSDFYGYPLMSCKFKSGSYFGAAFNSLFVDNNSNESIFELAFNKNNDNMLCNGPISNFYGAIGLTGWVTASNDIQTAAQKTGKTLFGTNDGRRYENFRFNAGGDVLGINKYTVSNMIKLSQSASYANDSWGTQYPTYGDKQDSRNKSNYIIYRLTDIMLLKAEALTQMISGDTITEAADEAYLEQAFELVDAVSKRSQYQSKEHPESILSVGSYRKKNAIANLVCDERQRELMFEGKRWFDLVRRSMRDGNTDYLRGKARQRNTSISSIIDNFLNRLDAIFWPYNLDELKANDQLKQNPAFGSGENSSYERN